MDLNSIVADWIDSLWLLGIGVAGVFVVILGLRRDDAIGWIYVAAGIALAALGFGAQFFGWDPLSL